MDRYRHLHPWRGANLDDALENLRWRLRDSREYDGLSPFVPIQRDPHAIPAREAKIGREIPSEIASLYSAFEGCGPIDESIWVWPLDSIRWLDVNGEDSAHNVLLYFSETNSPWASAEYLAFGQGSGGDGLCYCVNSPRGRDGLIVMLDHEEQGPHNNPDQPPLLVVLADSLAEWIERMMAFDFFEPGYSPACVEDIPKEPALAIATDHLRLNPGMTWLEELLASLE